MPKQLTSIGHLLIKINKDFVLESISTSGVADDGLGYTKAVNETVNAKALSQEEQDAALLLVKLSKNRIEAKENLVAKPDPSVDKP